MREQAAGRPVPAPPREVREIVAARMRGRRQFVFVQLAMLGALVVAVLSAVGIGAAFIPPLTVVQVITHHLFGVPGHAGWPVWTDAIVWQVRLPRVVLAVVLGGGLALAGMIIQALVRNPLADPSILGVEQGASVGAVLVIALGYQTGSYPVSTTAAAFAGGGVALIAVFALAQTSRTISPLRLVLVGVALSYGFSALTDFVIFASPNTNLQTEILFWLLGSLGGATWSQLLLPMIAFIVIVLAALFEAGRFDAISSGDETAKALGINPDGFRTRMMIVVALFVATSVVAAGVIAFVGLVTPHVARLLVGADHRRVGPTSVLLGATFLVLVDLIARTAFDPTELPLSVVTAVFGVPFFIWLLRRRRGALASAT